jgi:hypothetical protein
MVERQLPKLHTRVRFPSPAPALLSSIRNWLFKVSAVKKSNSNLVGTTFVQHAQAIEGVSVGVRLVEQLTLNQRVQGSSPCAPTTFPKKYQAKTRH